MRELSFVIPLALLNILSVEATELTEKLSMNGVLSGALQCQQLSDETIGEDTCKAGVPLQPELTYRPTMNDSLFLKLGFAAGNGLNDVSPFNLSAWGADLHEDVINVRGSGRDYLLTAGGVDSDTHPLPCRGLLPQRQWT